MSYWLLSCRTRHEDSLTKESVSRLRLTNSNKRKLDQTIVALKREQLPIPDISRARVRNTGAIGEVELVHCHAWISGLLISRVPQVGVPADLCFLETPSRTGRGVPRPVAP